MSLASLFGGLALGNAGLGAVHGFAAPIGGMFAAPHGAVCAALLPQVMEINIRALRERMPESVALRRYDDVARILTNDRNATPGAGIDWVRKLCGDLQIQPLRSYGIGAKDFPLLVETSAKSRSMKGNPISLTAQEMNEILERAL